LLINAGADVNARGEDGGTPLHLAAENNENPDIITNLLNAGADGTAVNSDGETPFDLAKDNEALASTDAYWALSDARFE
jgi:ankyrin repeat protein